MHRPLLVLALAVSAAFLPAQMSGKYTVDPLGSGARNYPSFGAIAKDLTTKGVSGPVEVVVASGNHLPFSLNPVPGASVTNRVTVRAAQRHKARIDIGYDNVSIGGVAYARWIVFDGFDFYASRNRNSKALIIRGHDIEIRHCRFNRILQCDGDRLHLHHCHVQGYYLWLTAVSEYRIHHNEFVAAGAGVFKWTARSGAVRSLVYNNLFHGWLTEDIGVLMRGDVDFVHNTVHYHTPGNGSRQVAVWISGRSLVRNNIIVHLSQGKLLSAGSGVQLDHNVYYGPSSTILINSYTSLAAWQKASGKDKGSRVVVPGFVNGGKAATDLRLLPGSPAAGNGGTLPSYVTDDFAGATRPARPSIGAYEGVPGTLFHEFGTGCAGAFNNVPAIGYTGDLKMGSTDFHVTLSNALGGSSVKTFFAAGARKLTVPFGGGCSLLVSPDLVMVFAMSGTSGPGNGRASVKLPLPSDPKLKGVQAHFQWGVIDAAAKGIGVAFSNGATLTL